MNWQRWVTMCAIGAMAVVGALYLAGCEGSHYSAERPANGWPAPLNQQRAAVGERRSGHTGASPSRPAPGAAARQFGPVDEVWVIAKPAADQPDHHVGAAPDAAPFIPAGALVTYHPQTQREVALPLEHTDVRGSVVGYIATVDVTQRFANPYDSKIEAMYVFPLPEDAAVSDFVMTIGERRIRGIIRERAEAERIYFEARREGLVASLLTQQRPNVFTQRVANIEPGRRIDVSIRYFNTLRYDDGWYEFVFPMVVGPRFNPAGTIDGIGATARAQQGDSGQRTEVQYLRPEERSGHDIALSVALDPGVRIEAIDSVNHRIVAMRQSASRVHYSDGERRWDEVVEQAVRVTPDEPIDGPVTVSLASDDTLPNRDFVLRFRVAGDTVRSSMLTYEDERGGYFTMMLYPPGDLRHLPRQPLEMIFVLDCSGSMRGRPLEQAREAVRWAVRHLEPGDTFQIVRFSDRATASAPRPVPATGANVRDALTYLDRLEADGGTMMLRGVEAALRTPRDDARYRVVAFLTDGYIGNESDVLGTVERHIGDARIFSFGVGSAPNRYLMYEMARVGRGAVAYLSLNDEPADVMERYLARISRPALTDVAINFGDMDVYDVYPSRLNDLFVGRPVVLTGRYRGERGDDVLVTGRAGGETLGMPVTVRRMDQARGGQGVAQVWARHKLADMQWADTIEPGGERRAHMLRLALDHALVSPYTAFVAVDATRRTEGRGGTTVPVAVPVPDGVHYETTVPR